MARASPARANAAAAVPSDGAEHHYVSVPVHACGDLALLLLLLRQLRTSEVSACYSEHDSPTSPRRPVKSQPRQELRNPKRLPPRMYFPCQTLPPKDRKPIKPI